MRRPEVELSDAAARYVEEHPAVIEKLAAGISDGPVVITEARRARFRGYVRDKLAYAQSAEADAAGKAWLARYGLTDAQIR